MGLSLPNTERWAGEILWGYIGGIGKERRRCLHYGYADSITKYNIRVHFT